MSNVLISSIKFRKFKAFNDYVVNFKDTNILVGPNNSGKSTVINALRILEASLRNISKKSPTIVNRENGQGQGYIIPAGILPVTLENVHTNYADENSKIEIKFTDSKKLILLFYVDGGCSLYWEAEEKAITSYSHFKHNFPFSLQVVPVLGPIEQDEKLLTSETVKRSLGTHRASRHFRNYWYKSQENFDDFRTLIQNTWPGMSIKVPELIKDLSDPPPRLVMFCVENRRDRELAWAGFGFQIWCQLLTHISRSANADFLVIDEPEIYLHPDVQRQLLNILREIKPAIVLATHSTEIIAEAEPEEILLIDKSKKRANRLHDISGIQETLDIIGSLQNIQLTKLAKTKKILFVESDEDFKIIRAFAKILGYKKVFQGEGITSIPSGGFSSWKNVNVFSREVGKVIFKFTMASVYDRDYACAGEIEEIRKSVSGNLDFIHFHDKKEIENYLLNFNALQRAINAEIMKKKRPFHFSVGEIECLLNKIAEESLTDLQSQYVTKYQNFYKSSGKDNSDLFVEAIKIFKKKWNNASQKMDVVSGKKVLKELRNHLRNEHSISLTNAVILSGFRAKDVSDDMKVLISEIDRFQKL